MDVTGPDDCFDPDEVTQALQRVFGLVGICQVLKVPVAEPEVIAEEAVRYIDQTYDLTSPVTFKVHTRRANKQYPVTSMEVDALVGEKLLGAFEGKNYMELDGDPTYQAWVDSGGMGDFPQGESPAAFKERCVSGFRMLMAGMDGTAAFVVHGGTIMAVCEALHGGEFYSYHLPNGGMYRCDWDGQRLHDLEKL